MIYGGDAWVRREVQRKHLKPNVRYPDDENDQWVLTGWALGKPYRASKKARSTRGRGRKVIADLRQPPFSLACRRVMSAPQWKAITSSLFC